MNEARFVETTEEIEDRRANSSLQNVKPPAQTVTLRLPETMIEDLKFLARQRDISFQTLVKAFLAEKLEKELQDL